PSHRPVCSRGPAGGADWDPALACRMDLAEHGPQLVSFAAAGGQQPDGLARTWRTDHRCLDDRLPSLNPEPAHASAHASEVQSLITQRETARRGPRIPIADYERFARWHGFQRWAHRSSLIWADHHWRGNSQSMAMNCLVDQARRARPACR